MYLLVLLPSYLCPSPYYERSAGRSVLLRVARLTGNLLFYKYLGSFEARGGGALSAFEFETWLRHPGPPLPWSIAAASLGCVVYWYFLPILLYSTVVYIVHFTVWRAGLAALARHSVRSRQSFPLLYTLLFPLQASIPAHRTVYCRVRLYVTASC